MKPEEIKVLGILGTGTVGWSWATFFASKGIAVKMFDADKSIQEMGVRKAKEGLESLVEYGSLDKSQLDSALGNISTADDVAQMAEGADYIQESVYESYEVKQEVFRQLDALVSPRTILASSTSGLLISRIQEAAAKPGRCIVVHPFNPPHLVPLVELVPGPQTDVQVTEDVRSFFERLGKIPVVLKKEAPGHVANRLAAALWREAIDIVIKGIASVEDVDKALHAGPGIRWALMGQHLIYHLGGGEGGYEYLIDHLGKAASAQWKDLATWTEIPEGAKEMLVEGVKESMGNRSMAEVAQWRDRKIVELTKIIYGDPMK
jgi:carnitine 3-dehydrogenase